jgi:large subunit ribosomal protein L10
LPGSPGKDLFVVIVVDIGRKEDIPLAFTKKEKNEMLAQYQRWLEESQAVFMMSYSHMKMKDIDALRAKAREAGGQAHVVKNTLMELALKDAGIDEPMVGSTLVGFALQDAPALAKVFSEATKSDVFELKLGFLEKRKISPNQIKDLADLPPLPVMRARILGAINAPASQLARTLAEPGRRVAAVVKAYSEKDAAAVEAPAA